MGFLLLIVTVIAGAFAGNRLAKWRGLDTGLMTYGGLLVGLIAIPAGFFMRGNPEKSTGTKTSALSMVALWVLCLFTSFAVAARAATEDSHRETINQIIKDNFTDSIVEADYVSLPMMGFAPLLMSEYAGYFTLKGKSSASLPEKCRLITVDFTARAAGDNYILAIAPKDIYWPTCGN